MGKMTLEDLIDELAVFLDNCKATPFSAGKVSVPKEEFLAQLEELKMEIPSEVERSREIVARKDMIIAEAQSKAEATINNAAKEAAIMIDESEIVAMANMRADEIINAAKEQAAQIIAEANEEADGIQIGAMQYTSSMMAGLENMFSTLFDIQKEQYGQLVEGLGANLSKIKQNRAEIDTQLSIWIDSQEDADEE
jgi:cell division septum initiation protein DivIVA